MVHTNPTIIERADLPQYFATIDEVAQFLAYYTALIMVDPQRAFTSSPDKGRLATLLGHEVMKPTNQIARLPIWKHRRATKDWHGPKWHVSWVEIRTDLVGDPKYDTVPYVMTYDEFKTWTPGTMPIVQEAQRAGINYDNLGDYLSRSNFQFLWPRGRHAEAGSSDARFHVDLDISVVDGVTLKGTIVYVDSLGAFADNGGMNETRLNDDLHDLGIQNAVFACLCTEYCVEFSVMQAIERGYGAMVLTDCVRPVNVNPDDEAKSFARMYNNGALLADSSIVREAAKKLGKIS
jgi:nicotinamidase-related amidase